MLMAQDVLDIDLLQKLDREVGSLRTQVVDDVLFLFGCSGKHFGDRNRSIFFTYRAAAVLRSAALPVAQEEQMYPVICSGRMTKQFD